MDDDKIIKKMVDKMVDDMAENAKTMSTDRKDVEGFKRILPSLLEKGVDHINLSMEHSDALSIVIKMYEAARVGPNFPLAVLQDKDACLSCGYKKACYGEKGNVLMSAAVDQLIRENKRERDFLTGYRRDSQSSLEAGNEQT